MTDLDMIEPTGTPVEFSGQTVYITPLKVGQLPAFSRAIKPLAGQIPAIMTAGTDPAAWLGLIGDHGEAIIEATSIASGISREQIEAATIDQLVGLALVAMQVNADFFKGRLIPAITAAVQTIKPTPAPGAGLTR